MYYYAYIDANTGVCYDIEIYDEPLSDLGSQYVQLDSYEASYIIRKKYVNGEWLDSTAEEGAQWMGEHGSLHGEWLDVVVDSKAPIEHTHSEYADVDHTHSNYSLTTHTHTASEVGAAASSHNHDSAYAPLSHTHSNYATTTALNELTTTVSGKANATHSHNDTYYTEAEVNTKLSSKADTSHTHTISNVTNLQSTLDGKAATSHGTHVSYSTTAPVMDGTASVGSASTVARSDHKHPTDTSRASQTDLNSLSSTVATKANATHTHTEYAPLSHSHTISNIDGLQTALDGKAASSHKHYATSVTTTGEDLDDYTDAGIYTFAQSYAPTNVPAGSNGWLIVIPWTNGSSTIKQIWLRHGTVGSNDFETYVRTKVGTNAWGSWSKYYTTSNPPTYAEVGASPACTNSSGGVEYSYGSGSGKNVLTEISNMPQGLHTAYAISGTTGNPRTSESFRFLIHKTSSTIGWIMAWDAQGSVFTNYQSAANTFKGWKCLYDASPTSMILWKGASYLTSTNSTPQVVTPSKKLSECRTGWMLLWSDYDPGDGANDTDFCTTFIPKYTPTGGTWGGKAFYCDLPLYVGSDATDLSTEKRCIKPIYVHDDCIKGSYQNSSGGRNDVVLRAVYEV